MSGIFPHFPHLWLCLLNMCCSLRSYTERVTGVDSIFQSLLGEMTQAETYMLDIHDVIEIQGKIRFFSPFQLLYIVPFFAYQHDFSYYPRCTSSEKDISNSRLMFFYIFPVVPVAKRTFLIDA